MKILHKTQRPNWVRGCTGKIRHREFEAAQKHLEHMQMLCPNIDFHIYRCAACETFHVGSVPWSKRRKGATA